MKRLTAALIFTAFASPALAHLPPGEYGSFAAGFSHPLFGFDHILAMATVGLWASVIGGKALWIVPGAFVGAMVVGFGLALSGVALPAVEPMIVASTIALGLAVALAVRLDIRVCAAFVALFAVFHGHAHGGELGEAAAARFGVGFMIATVLLHVSGIGLGMLLARLGARHMLARALGAGAAVAGIALAVG